MTEREAGLLKGRINSQRYYLRHLDACRARSRAYYHENREKWLGPNGYKRRTVQA